jgi:hypothetical protein
LEAGSWLGLTGAHLKVALLLLALKLLDLALNVAQNILYCTTATTVSDSRVYSRVTADSRFLD